MDGKLEKTVENVLSKQQMLEYVKNNIEDAECAIMFLAKKDSDGMLHLEEYSTGFKWTYEIVGFMQWVNEPNQWEDIEEDMK